MAPNLTINDVTVTEGNGGTKNATFTLSLSATPSSAMTVDYSTADGTATSASVTTTQSNAGAVSIPSSGAASPYPSAITVSAGLGTIRKVTAQLNGFSHTWPEDVDVLLVGPTGQTVLLMSDVGDSTDAANLTLTFDDSGASLPSIGALSSGTFKPTNHVGSCGNDTFPSPAPGGTYGSALTAFNSTDPAGEWRLFV